MIHRTPRWLIHLAYCGFLLYAPGALSVEESGAQRFSVMQNGEKVGNLLVQQYAHRYKIDFQVKDNGRGTWIRETVQLGADGFPMSWSIRGVSDHGAPVRERFAVASRHARWSSLEDSGAALLAGPRLYVASNTSPWSYGLYLRILLDGPGGKLNVLPSGTLRADRLPNIELGYGATAQSLEVYALWGVQTYPEIVMLTSAHAFFAAIDGIQATIPSGFEAAYPRLAQLADARSVEYLQRLTQQLVHHAQGPVYIRNVRVFDSKRATLGALTNVVVFRDRIASVRADLDKLPADATLIEGEGGTILPGLTDIHDHLSLWDIPLDIAAGVTTARDPGNINESLLTLTKHIESGSMMGPRLIRAGLLEGRSPFSVRLGFVIEQLPEALEKVRWYADHGYRSIKIYSSMPPDFVPPIAAEAHRLGMRVSGHVPAFMSAESAVRAGYDEINHLNQLVLSWIIDVKKDDTRTPFRFTALGERTGKLDLRSEPVQRVIRLLKERGTTIDTTASVLAWMLLGRPGQVKPTDAEWISHLPAPVQRQRLEAVLDIKPSQDPLYRASWSKLLELIKMLEDAGIRILPGTDETPGFLLHSELEVYHDAGISNARILQIATLECARYLGLDQDLGSIEPGKRADLILVAGDPVERIGNIRQVRMVIKDGAISYPQEIYETIGIEPFAAKPDVLQPQPPKSE